MVKVLRSTMALPSMLEEAAMGRAAGHMVGVVIMASAPRYRPRPQRRGGGCRGGDGSPGVRSLALGTKMAPWGPRWLP